MMKRENIHVLSRALTLVVEGQWKKGRPKKTWKISLRKKLMVSFRMEDAFF